MRKTLPTLCLGISVMILSIPAWGQPPKVYSPPATERNVVRFQLGYFEPSGLENSETLLIGFLPRQGIHLGRRFPRWLVNGLEGTPQELSIFVMSC